METLFTLPVMACIAASLALFTLGFVITVHPAVNRRFFTLPTIAQKIYVALFMAPLVALPLVPQERFAGFDLPSLVGGAFLCAAALALWVSALRAMRGIPSIRETRGLVTGGAYGLVRNPLYTGDFIIVPGLALLTHSVAALLYTPVLLVLFLALSLIEERQLTAAYGDAYRAYRARVPKRLIPFVV